MKKIVLFLFCLFVFFISASYATSPASIVASPQTVPVLMPDTHRYSQDKGALISNIKIEGFVLEDKNQFVKLFKPYRNKHLLAVDMDTILQKIQEVYEQAGYQGLVSIEYHVKGKSLRFTVSLIK